MQLFMNMSIILFLAFHLRAVCDLKESASSAIVNKSGDFIIAAIFEIGVGLNNTISSENTSCKLTDSSVYPLEKAMVFQDLMEKFDRVGNYSIGYEIYSGCRKRYLTQRISSRISQNKKVVGLIASDVSSSVQFSIGAPTSFLIPTIGYIYSEDAFLEEEQYPTYLSLIETEEMEARTMINLLIYLDLHFVDIWYNSKSQAVAEYVHKNFILKRGGGRYIKYDGKDGVQEEFADYDSYVDVPTAPVQILLFNGYLNQVKPFLNEALKNRGWRNKTYIFGYTVSRDLYRKSHKVELDKLASTKEGSDLNEIFIYQRSDLQNLNIDLMTKRGGFLYESARRSTNRLAKDYSLKKECNFTYSMGDLSEDCGNTKPFTSWMGYVAVATQLFQSNLKAVLSTLESLEDVFDIRRKLFARIKSGNHQTDLYGQHLDNITFIRNTLAKGYEIIELHMENINSTEISRGRVSFDKTESMVESELQSALRDDVIEQGATVPCSVTCLPGSQVNKTSSAPELSNCWKCIKCTGNSISNTFNSDQCIKCGDDERAAEDNTVCQPVLENFVTLKSPKFLVGLFLSIAGIILVALTMVYILLNVTRPVVRASDPMFCFLLLGSLGQGNLLAVTALLEPSTITCNCELYQASFFVSCVCTNLCYRSLKIYKIFMAAVNMDMRRPFFFKLLTWYAHVAIVIVTGVWALLLTVLTILQQGWVYERTLVPHKSVHKVCTSANFLATTYPFILSSFLLLVTLVLAYKMRLFPHNFKETTTIFTTCLLLVVICLMFLSGYSISEPPQRALLRAIVYFCITQTFLFCLFLPKILVLVKKDDLVDPEGNLSTAIQTFCAKDEQRKSLTSQDKESKNVVSTH